MICSVDFSGWCDKITTVFVGPYLPQIAWMLPWAGARSEVFAWFSGRKRPMMDFSKKLIDEYERKSNRSLALVCRIMMVFMGLVIVLNAAGIFTVRSAIYPTMAAGILVMALPTVIYNVLDLDAQWLRYLIITMVVGICGLLYAILSFHVVILLVFPVVLSCLYCERRCVLFASALSLPMLVVSHLAACVLKVVESEPLTALYDVMVYGLLPRVFEFVAIAIICLCISNKTQDLVSALAEKNRALYQDQEALVTSLAAMVEAQSQSTGQHVMRVGKYTEILCRALGMEDEEVWKVSNAAKLHDVGKIMVPQDILYKPGRLTPEEFAVVKKHTHYGGQLLEHSQGELLHIAATIALEHHERYDGTGYMGLKGSDISLYARCVALADVFDALVSVRCYKSAWTPDNARNEILSERGTHFDPEIVDLFLAHYDEFLQVLAQYPDTQLPLKPASSM